MALRNAEYGREVTRGTTRKSLLLWCEKDIAALVLAVVMIIILPSGLNPKFVFIGLAFGAAGMLGGQFLARRDPRLMKKLRAHRRWAARGSASLPYYIDESTGVERALAFLGLQSARRSVGVLLRRLRARATRRLA